MRRVFALVTLLPLLTVSTLFAQHGGGRASGGGHGGMSAHSGGFAGHSYGSGFSGAHSNFSGRSSGGVYSYSGPLSSRAYGHSGVGVRIRPYGYRNCYVRGCGLGYGYGGYYPSWYAGAIDPYWWWDNGSSYDQDQQYETGLANEMNQQSLEEQQMRDQSQQGDQDVYARSSPPPPRAQESSEAVPNTVLVFRDQRKEEVQNYAIVGQTLWNFAPQHTQKIPLSELDLSATVKANDDRGVDFHVPGSREGQ